VAEHERATNFCEIGVIGLIGAGSSSTRHGPTHTQAKWRKTERRLSRFHRFRRTSVPDDPSSLIADKLKA
jgi:hypothetical protein